MHLHSVCKTSFSFGSLRSLHCLEKIIVEGDRRRTNYHSPTSWPLYFSLSSPLSLFLLLSPALHFYFSWNQFLSFSPSSSSFVWVGVWREGLVCFSLLLFLFLLAFHCCQYLACLFTISLISSSF